MREVVLEATEPAFRWIDVVAPDRDELFAIANEFGFHANAVEDCLDPWHLPKHEKIDGATFVILRVADPHASGSGTSVQELTRKIAIFFRPGLLVTIHRAELDVITKLRERFRNPEPSPVLQIDLLGALFNGSLDSFEGPLDRADDEVDTLEDELLGPGHQMPDLEVIHVLKRRVTIIKRLLWQTTVVLQRLVPIHERGHAVIQDVKENAEAYFFYADTLVEEISNLLHIHVALSSHRTNEVMRVLTVFAAFFLPLTFIVGVYGMNFDWMPELRARWGYPAVLGLMAVVCVVIAVWFYRRGWLRRGRA